MTLRDWFRRRPASSRPIRFGFRKDHFRTRLGIERCEPRRVLAAVPGLDDTPVDADPTDDVWHTLDTEAEVLEVDLSITITNGREIFEPGGTARYTVIVTNAGPDTATGARVAVSLPQALHAATWSAIYSPSASGAASGAGSGSTGIDTLVTLPSGGAAIFTLTGTVDEQAFGQLRVAASVTPPADAADPDALDRSAADVDRRPLLVVGAEAARVREGGSLPQQVQVVDAATGAVLAGFEAFGAVPLPNGRSLRPGVRASLADVDGDGVDEVVATPSSGPVGEVRVFRLRDDGTYLEDQAWRTRPFGDEYRGGLRVTTGDFDADGDHDIAVSKDRGTTLVSLFESSASGATAFEPSASFTPFAADSRGGSALASADLNGDGRSELLAASGPRLAPVVKVYGLSTGSPTEVDSITPSTAIKGAISISVGRFNADATPDIMLGGGRGSSGRVEIYDGTLNATTANAKLSGSEAFTTPFAGTAGVNAAVFASGVDLDGDGRIDRVVVAQGRGSAAQARAFARSGEAIPGSALPFGQESMLSPSTVDPSIVQTASGLQYRDLVVGSGALPVNGQRIAVHYVGSLVNGTIFDDSRSARPGRTGEPFEFTLGARQVIAGWDEGLATMRVGGRRTLIIPAALGYGSAGTASIPPNSTLIFDVELLGVT